MGLMRLGFGVAGLCGGLLVVRLLIPKGEL
jgi:hypothetical protein